MVMVILHAVKVFMRLVGNDHGINVASCPFGVVWACAQDSTEGDVLEGVV